MADPTWLAGALRAEGCKVVEMPGYLNRGHGDFGNVWGSMIHHTGSAGKLGAAFIRDGRPDLPGPIANAYMAPDGTITLVAIGVAYHAGRGSYPGIPTNNGNFVLIGLEIDFGHSSMPRATPAQYEAAVRFSAAITRRLNKTAANSVVGHKEYAAAQGKWDPANWDMDQFRRDVQARVQRPPNADAAPMPDGWTLAAGEYYGPLEGPDASISGLYGEPRAKMGSLRAFQEKMGIPVTGVFDGKTRDMANKIQAEHRLPITGYVTVETFAKAMAAPSAAPPAPPATVDWNTPTASIVDPSKKYPLAAYPVFSDFHSFHASSRAGQILERLDGVEDSLKQIIERLDRK